jgi:hypothetical protein
MYSDLVLKYKGSKNIKGNIFQNTDSIFSSKYFSGGKSEKKFTPPFIPGEIYSFQYNTDTKLSKDRKFIDRNPIVLCTDAFQTNAGTILKGIDLITVPNSIRVDIIGRIYDSNEDSIKYNDKSYQSNKARSPINLSDKILAGLLDGTGYKYSLFGFKGVFIKNPKVLDLEDWPKLPYLKKCELEGLTADSIYKEYQSKLI